MSHNHNRTDLFPKSVTGTAITAASAAIITHDAIKSGLVTFAASVAAGAYTIGEVTTNNSQALNELATALAFNFLDVNDYIDFRLRQAITNATDDTVSISTYTASNTKVLKNAAMVMGTTGTFTVSLRVYCTAITLGSDGVPTAASVNVIII